MRYSNDYRDEWLDEEPAIITIREVIYDPLAAPTLGDTTLMPAYQRRQRRTMGWLWPILALLLVACIGGSGLAIILLVALPEKEVFVIVENPADNSSAVSPIFTPEVQFWADEILVWSTTYNLNPNLIATVIQIESCGDPTAGSGAGAQGLFQVMPFHFAQGESMLDVQTNAKRGLSYLAEGLVKAEGNALLAMAGYNGGHGVIDWGWARWSDETRRYFYWASGIYQDAMSGKTSSERLNEWLAAGGSRLCTQAAAVQSTLPAS